MVIQLEIRGAVSHAPLDTDLVDLDKVKEATLALHGTKSDTNQQNVSPLFSPNWVPRCYPLPGANKVFRQPLVGQGHPRLEVVVVVGGGVHVTIERLDTGLQ